MHLTFCDHCVAVLEQAFESVQCIVVHLVRTQFLQSQTVLQAVLLCGCTWFGNTVSWSTKQHRCQQINLIHKDVQCSCKAQRGQVWVVCWKLLD